MSKRDIITVCTLAAHLAQRKRASLPDPEPGEIWEEKLPPARCAADAMKLQRLAQNLRGRCVRAGRTKWDVYLDNMCAKIGAVLKPYGLTAAVSGKGIRIEELPSNDASRAEGFGI